ncbi:hypothetical protein GT037_000113 [Alternaria burnsii]|uniref:PARP-type domain-containing protein n=1 Tax=Alternaria burnsii TaxID=1187904 RepID=A0A8H7BKD1_9PLEO|nr:uncharacterized protein GT037_000113 [Alternaria burnsii]KAF7681137.1 hypothetical protein GT037_000113 [Alternaria burnsii]
MGVYRVEESPNNRAGCQVKECKDSGSKIMKGQFRYATQVTIKDHVSWQYRHWGCVTPKQIENLIETCGGDTDMVDGYDELPAEFQEKVDFALKNGHIPDEDCTRDPELNRPGVKKPRAKKAKKGAEDNDGEDAASPPKKKRATKAKKNEVKDEVEDEEEEEAPAPAPKKRATKAKKVKAEDQDEQDVPAPAPAPKKRGRPAKKEVEEEDDDEEAAPPAKKARASGRAKKAVQHTDASDKEAPKPKKARGKKATVENPDPEPEIGLDSEAEVLSDHAKEAPEPKKAPQKRGRKKAAAAAE